MVDGHHLLPCPQPQAPLANGQGDRRSQQGGLDVAVTVAVMPIQFMLTYISFPYGIEKRLVRVNWVVYNFSVKPFTHVFY